MCTNQKSLQKPSITTLIRPKSDPYIPITLLSTVTENTLKKENRNRETRSFDDLNSSIVPPPPPLTPSSESIIINTAEDGSLKKNIVKSCKNCSYTFHCKPLLTMTPSLTVTPSSSCSHGSKSCSPSPATTTTTSTSSPSSCRSSSAMMTTTTTSDEFCCKDCETCYTLFNAVTPVTTAPSKPIVKQSTFDVRQSIYAFQQQLLRSENQDHHTSDDSSMTEEMTTAVTTNISHNDEHDRQQQQRLKQQREERKEKEEVDPKELLKAAKKQFNVQYFQTLKKEKRQISNHNSNNINKLLPPSTNLAQDPLNISRGNHGKGINNNINNNNNVFGWFFNQPKPVRPQLHAFI